MSHVLFDLWLCPGQVSLRVICKALCIARDPHAGTWSAAARLAARHAAELQPGIAASVLRSYAAAGGTALDGGREGLSGAVWAALEPRLGELDAAVLLDLLYGNAKLSASGWWAAAGSDDGVAAAAEGRAVAEAAWGTLPTLCQLLTPRVTALSCSDVSMLAAGLAQAQGAAAAAGVAAGIAGDQAERYGVLPRLLSDMLLLRGLRGFGAGNFASVALALGLLGQRDARFWSRVAAEAAGEVPAMEAVPLAKLTGALVAGLSPVAPAEGGPAAAAGGEAAAAARKPGASPGREFVDAAFARVDALLAADGMDGGRAAVREWVFLLRALAEWKVVEAEAAGGAGEEAQGSREAMLRRLADVVVSAEAGTEAGGAAGGLAGVSPLAQAQLVGVLRAAGLGSHPLIGRLQSQ